MKIGLVYNGKNPPAATARPQGADWNLEFDDQETIEAVARALSRIGEVVEIEAVPGCREKLAFHRPDLVFNIAEGFDGPNREAEIPMILDELGIPYTGAGPEALRFCLDKHRTADFLRRRGVPAPRGRVFTAGEKVSWDLSFPAIVKPLREGSSKGIRDDCLVGDLAEMADKVDRITRRYRQPALVEEFLAGREFTCALIGNNGDLELLPPVEINLAALPPGARPIYSYEAKWVWDRPEDPLPIFTCPAEIDENLKSALTATARRAYLLSGCRDWARIDLRLDRSGVPHSIEINPLPGILPRPEDNSCFPKAARAAGLSYDDLIARVVETAKKRCAL